ncbi:MAG: hypothetical protein JNJ90_04905 [Saprospiraceae bacterium]|jgi:hypothetical protein|nr:hypothetical protein [Saprospiraceae bacterium]
MGEALKGFDDAASIGTAVKNGVIGVVFNGLIGGAIAGAIGKRNPPAQF